MSDTPRTDAAAWKGSDLGLANAWASGIWNLARTLERELAAVTRERDEAYERGLAEGRKDLSAIARDFDAGVAREQFAEMKDERDALRAEVERLRAALSLYRFDKDMTGQYGAEAALQEPTP